MSENRENSPVLGEVRVYFVVDDVDVGIDD